MLLDRLNDFLPASARKWQKRLWFWLNRARAKRLFSHFISPNELVFDIGANIGSLTEVFLELGGKVVCVEPQSSCLGFLKKRFAGNPRVTIVAKGVGPKTGKAVFYASSDHPETSTFSKDFVQKSRFKHRRWEHAYEVPVITLEILIKKFGLPKFCKLDTEGYEWPILKSLSSKIPFLAFEFNREFFSESEKCIRHLGSLGKTEFNFSPGSTYAFTNEWCSGKEIVKKLRSLPPWCPCGDIYVRIE
jgi:FkbM family methyltransferase